LGEKRTQKNVDIEEQLEESTKTIQALFVWAPIFIPPHTNTSGHK
jgi:hypothetical protein